MKTTRKQKKSTLEFLGILGISFAAFNFFLMSIRVSGKSMLPTYVDGERGFMFKKTPFNSIKRNDVVVIKLKPGNTLIIKRVIGLPNDSIEIKDNKIYLNNKKIRDINKKANSYMQDYPNYKLKSDEYFVLGDNRDSSRDSRYFGAIKEENIVAVNGVMFYPFNKVGTTK